MLAIPVIIFRLIAYAMVPILIFVKSFLETQWPLFPAIASTTAISNIAAYTQIDDSNLIIFQFIYWLACWTLLLGSYGFPFPSLPFDFGEYINPILFVIIAATFPFFSEALFYCLIITVPNSASLGKFGVLHQWTWEWVSTLWKAWKMICNALDSICTAFGAICTALGTVIAALGGRPRDSQVIVAQASNREDDVSHLDSASLSPPPYNLHDIDSHFLSSQVNKGNLEVPV